MVYVDDLIEYGPAFYRDAQTARTGSRNGDLWCHLYADSEEELHAFAARIGMKRAWFQRSRRGTPHYDLVPRRRARAVELGAQELTRREARILRERLRAAGGES